MGLIDRLGITRKITRSRLESFLGRYATQKQVLDIGCGNSMYGNFFPNRVTMDIEVRSGVQVDIVGDAHSVPQIADNSFDCILCTEVLEHLHTPEKAMDEFFRILRPGGTLVLSTRFIFPLHDVPGDYYRYTKYGLKHLFKKFEILELTEEASTMETLAVLYQRIGFQCDTFALRPFKLFWFLLAKFAMLFSGAITKEFGDIRHKQVEQNILSSGYYVAAKKPM